MSSLSSPGQMKAPPLIVVLGLLGVLLVAGASVFLFKIYGSEDSAVDDGVVTLLIVGLSTLIVVEILPTLQNLKFGKDGVDVTFRELGEKVTNDTGALEARIVALEAEVKALRSAAAPAVKRAAPPSPEIATPGRDMFKAGRFYDDPRKGRFGGKAADMGFVLSAAFSGPRDKSWADVILTVRATDEAGDTSSVESVEFYLHNSFNPDERAVPFCDGAAELVLTCWGGFTVGVWIPARGVALELDLAELANAPKVVKEL
jgi:hypothetical protein